MEDLNYLLKREQEELLRAQSAHCRAASHAHQRLANRYAQRIREHVHPYRSERPDGSAPFALKNQRDCRI
ncbi:hypothetical protein JQK15_21005 [Sphingobium sp. BHU LFT2]|uniref:hypothetical protein n=1 Tax=Sphingobium sp. BHU LFT2 TaxID=2807634 RepID=UPI001BE9493A|nr:hypothetical protein [Sphingobium sp. BHU LFT2]MBT2245994.1 hypothetical protein [Sphingobium sp. BHU LFT2]